MAPIPRSDGALVFSSELPGSEWDLFGAGVSKERPTKQVALTVVRGQVIDRRTP